MRAPRGQLRGQKREGGVVKKKITEPLLSRGRHQPAVAAGLGGRLVYGGWLRERTTSTAVPRPTLLQRGMTDDGPS